VVAEQLQNLRQRLGLGPRARSTAGHDPVRTLLNTETQRHREEGDKKKIE